MGDKPQPKAAASSNAHKILIESIVGAINENVMPQIATELAEVKILLSQVLARLELFGKEGAPAPAKRAPRGERKTGVAAAGNTDAADDPLSRLKNAMQFTAAMWALSEEFREAHANEEVQATFDTAATTKKHEAGSEARLKAEGNLIWKNSTAEEKDAIRAEFTRWKEERACQALEAPLEAEAEDE